MQVAKTFSRTRFPATVIAEAYAEIKRMAAELDAAEALVASPRRPTMTIRKGEEEWQYDEIDEWMGAYERENTGAWFRYIRDIILSVSLDLKFEPWAKKSTVTVSAPKTHQVEKVLNIFRAAEAASKIPDPPSIEPEQPPLVVFIGHGRSDDWRAVRDQLQDKHHYRVEAFEVGSRTGHSIRTVLNTMLQTSSFALLIMTAEDETVDGQKRARQNVVHEAGLFQGKLGFDRAVAVVEEGVEVFTNLDGVQQIRYATGHVESTFGDILAALRREFGDRR